MAEIPVTIMEKQLQDEARLFEAGVMENVYLNTTDDGKKRTSLVYFIMKSPFTNLQANTDED
jgi:hypothetical protein